jgi:hypothetical protein
MSSFLRFQKLIGVAVVPVVAGLALAGCGGSDKSSGGSKPGMNMGALSSPSASSSASDNSMAVMPGMSGQMSDGLAKSASGFTLAFQSATLPAGKPGTLRFRITGADGRPVTAFVLDDTKLLHFFLVRSDLTGYQHVHPTMAADGTWTASLAATQPGTYRAYAAFIARDNSGKAVPLVLSDTVTVPGSASPAALPAPSNTAKVDGYTLTLSGEPMAGMEHPLTVAVSKDGKPVTDLQPYLGTYAHLTAFHQNDMAFTHLHPEGTANGDHGGPKLTFHAQFGKPGTYRLFLQFRTGGTLHTAAFTLAVS